MKNAFYIALLTTALATPAFAQMATTTTTHTSSGETVTTTGTVDPTIATGKVVDVKDNSIVNPDGTATVVRSVTTETNHPDMVPAGVPADAKAHNVTTTTTSVTTPAGTVPAVAPVVMPDAMGTTTTRTTQEHTTVRVKNPDGTEKVIESGTVSDTAQ